MLDEFPSYGKLEVFQEALAYIAGYGIKAYLINQDMSQLWGAYGKDESVLSNCHVRIAFAPNRVETAEWLSRMCGTATVVKEDVTTSGKRFGAVLTQVSKTYHQISRPLATADEIMRLRSPVKDEGDLIVEPGEMLVFVAGHAPILGTQSLYFRDPVFLDRAQLPVPTTDSLHRSEVPPFQITRPPPRSRRPDRARRRRLLLDAARGRPWLPAQRNALGSGRPVACLARRRPRKRTCGEFLPAGDGRVLGSAPARLSPARGLSWRA